MAEHAVTLSLPNCQDTSAVAVIVERALPARALRASVALAGTWGAALVCVFVPLLHFVLVPSLLLVGLVVAALRLTERRTLQAVRGACPRCAVDRTFEASGRFKDGRALHCDGCGNDITIRAGPAQL
ncbi:MAG: hypothetical protein A2138_11860 [Deltaproteobacteria bacterium RBG_16_71_12]|nr:MAG: hypothetical protein A2138_11860 [Deltaproteobacteria bacterium RBG_16_71_12]